MWQGPFSAAANCVFSALTELDLLNQGSAGVDQPRSYLSMVLTMWAAPFSAAAKCSCALSHAALAALRRLSSPGGVLGAADLAC